MEAWRRGAQHAAARRRTRSIMATRRRSRTRTAGPSSRRRSAAWTRSPGMETGWGRWTCKCVDDELRVDGVCGLASIPSSVYVRTYSCPRVLRTQFLQVFEPERSLLVKKTVVHIDFHRSGPLRTNQPAQLHRLHCASCTGPGCSVIASRPGRHRRDTNGAVAAGARGQATDRGPRLRAPLRARGRWFGSGRDRPALCRVSISTKHHGCSAARGR